MRTDTLTATRPDGQGGIALVTTMLIMLLMSALMIGFTTAVMSDQRYRYIDRDRVRAFYAAQSGLEKLNADLALLFLANVSPSDAQVAALGEEEDEPDIDGVSFTTGTSAEAYGVTPVALDPGETGWELIAKGPYQGLIALKKRYLLDSSARTTAGGQAHLKRTVETVAIPVFQFGIFSDVDLGFHAGPTFQFGGRVHSNGNLFLAQGTGNTLTLPEKVTAFREVVREYLMNGNDITSASQRGTVRIARSANVFRPLTFPEGSVTGFLGSPLNDPSWINVSLSAYNGYIRNYRTGAKRLDLPVVTVGGANIDIARRPAANEDTANPTLFTERYYDKVSLRILLSDTAADLTALPQATAAAPVSLEAWIAGAPAGYAVGAGRPMIARSPGPSDATPTVAIAEAVGLGRMITLNGNIPNYWKIPATDPMRVSVAGVEIADDLVCPAKRETRFENCSSADLLAAGVLPVGATISRNRPSPDGPVPVSTTTTALWDPLIPSDLNVVSTLQFTPNTMWFTNTDDGQSVLVTCGGYSATNRFRDCNVPLAIDVGATVSNKVLSNDQTGLIGGFIKIEMQEADGDWRDVTMEILAHGIGDRNQLVSGAMSGVLCDDPSSNAILRLQRLRDNTESGAACSYAGSTVSSDYWPNTLYDPREALYRDVSPGTTTFLLGGVMHYIALDVRNLSRWFQGVGAYAGGSGTQALSTNGYSVYFSDRRNNRDLANLETGEYGHEDVINAPVANGASNGALDTGEDVNLNSSLEAYGNAASFQGVRGTAPPGAAAPLVGTATHTTRLEMAQAKVNRALMFRRALKLVNGGLGNIVAPGLTIVAENPVYVQGDWNASQAGFGDPHVATAIIADSVTVLSNNWTDNRSYAFAYAPASRPRSAQSYYRFAVIGGKNRPFLLSEVADAVATDFGSDGGAHNFLRMLEGGAGTVNYRGSIATFYYSRQAVGVYKCCTTVYGAPTRVFNFDTDFLNPALLPPLTPAFRDINAVGFWQETRPGF